MWAGSQQTLRALSDPSGTKPARIDTVPKLKWPLVAGQPNRRGYRTVNPTSPFPGNRWTAHHHREVAHQQRWPMGRVQVSSHGSSTVTVTIRTVTWFAEKKIIWCGAGFTYNQTLSINRYLDFWESESSNYRR